MKKLAIMILLAAAVASHAAAWIEHPAEGTYREFSSPGEVPDGQSEPLVENAIEGEYREFTSPGGDFGTLIQQVLWVLPF